MPQINLSVVNRMLALELVCEQQTTRHRSTGIIPAEREAGCPSASNPQSFDGIRLSEIPRRRGIMCFLRSSASSILPTYPPKIGRVVCIIVTITYMPPKRMGVRQNLQKGYAKIRLHSQPR